MEKISRHKLSVLVLLIISQAIMAGAQAEVVVVGSASGSATQLNADQVKDIYLGKVKVLPNGTPVVMADLPASNPVRNEFFEKILGKNEFQMKAYWAKEVFSGHGSQPVALQNDAAMKAWVSAKDGGGEHIGYIDSGSVDKTVKVLFKP